jgi:uncharacterized protein (TIGR02271 family)
VFTITEARELPGRNLVDANGDKVGSIGQLYLDDDSGEPEWVTVRTGLFGLNESFVPLQDATTEGDTVRVPYTKDQIKAAPNVSPEGGEHLPEEQEARLYEHYTMQRRGYGDAGFATSRSGRDIDAELAAAGSDRGADAAYETPTSVRGDAVVGDETAGYATGSDLGADRRDLGTDDAMTRSEERVRAGTERVATGRARLRKYVETEHVNVEVPVQREKARIVTEPITDANVDEATSGPDLTEAEHEVTLTEERPIVTTEAVPVERVRLEKDVEESVETVGTEVRKERIAAEGDVEGRNRG